MTYPSPEEVEGASRLQLARWYRFLPSPGLSHHAAYERGDISGEDVAAAIQSQARTLERISDRLKLLGGLSPDISRQIGWSE